MLASSRPVVRTYLREAHDTGLPPREDPFAGQYQDPAINRRRRMHLVAGDDPFRPLELMPRLHRAWTRRTAPQPDIVEENDPPDRIRPLPGTLRLRCQLQSP